MLAFSRTPQNVKMLSNLHTGLRSTDHRENRKPVEPSVSRRIAVALWIARIAAGLLIAFSLLGLLSWPLTFAQAMEAWLGLATMKFNTAMCFLFSGVTLAFSSPHIGRLRGAEILSTGIVIAISSLTLVQYAFGTDLGIDQLFFSDVLTPADQFPGRMSAITAAGFLLFGAGHFLSGGGGRAVSRAGMPAAAMLGLVIALAAFSGYLYQAPFLYDPIPEASIAFLTSVLFICLFVGQMASRPEYGLTALLVSSEAGGMMARRMLPLLIVLLPLLGWILLQGNQAGIYGSAMNAALLAITSVLVLSATIWGVAIHANRLDEERTRNAESLSRSASLLRENESRYRGMVEFIDIGIWTETAGRIDYANPCLRRMIQVDDGDDPSGGSALSYFHEDDREEARDYLQSRYEAAGSTSAQRDFRLVGRDGQLVTVELQAFGYSQNGEPHLMCICRDVTMLREYETQLRLSQKMQAIGQLTGGIAHDFNNLLTVIIGNLEIVEDETDGDLRSAVENAQRSAERGAALTHRLLAFSRQQQLQPVKLDVNELIRSIDGMIDRTIGEEIQVELRLAKDNTVVFADRNQVENVLLNLVINARDAMPEGGRLTISTGNQILDEDYTAMNPEVEPGRYVAIAVTDSGRGMSAEQIERAFEPFYTTKEEGKGTGLGLSMAYGFAKQSAGHLKIYSELGIGTTVRLYLPIDESAAGPGIAPAEGGETAVSGTGTILVVEDSSMVRALVVKQLGRLGYDTVEAENGPAAMEILQSDTAIDLLFTDMIMPGGMTGVQLAEQAVACRPELKTLFTSGYAHKGIAHQDRFEGDFHILPKPYRLVELSKKIREIIG